MAKVENAYPDQIVTADILTADVTLGAVGTFTEIGKLTVPPGQAFKMGTGSLRGQDNAEGRLYYDIVDDAAGPEEGTVRIVAKNPSQTKTRILYSGSTHKGRSGTADDRASHIAFAEQKGWIPENWTIRVEMMPAAAGDIVDVSASTFLMDVMKGDYVS